MREQRKWRRGKVSMTTCRGGARFGTTYFNDMLGTTVGIWEGRASARPNSGRKYAAAALTAFGETIENESCHSPTPTHNSNSFYTGKPHVAGLGHVFLFRNYRASLAKWQTADPLGYPDGWNQLAYCNNGVTGAVDLWGCKVETKIINYMEYQQFESPVTVIWYNNQYDTMTIFSKVVAEAAKADMSLKDYLTDKFDSWRKGRKKYSTDIAFNAMLNLLLKAYAEIYSECYFDSEPQDAVALDGLLAPYFADGWRVDVMRHKGITIDKDQKVPSGTLSTIIYAVNHHWEIFLKREVE